MARLDRTPITTFVSSRGDRQWHLHPRLAKEVTDSLGVLRDPVSGTKSSADKIARDIFRRHYPEAVFEYSHELATFTALLQGVRTGEVLCDIDAYWDESVGETVSRHVRRWAWKFVTCGNDSSRDHWVMGCATPTGSDLTCKHDDLHKTWMIRWGDTYGTEPLPELRKFTSRPANRPARVKEDVGTQVGPCLWKGVSYAQNEANFQASMGRHFKITPPHRPHAGRWLIAKGLVMKWIKAELEDHMPLKYPAKWSPSTIDAAWRGMTAGKMGMLEAMIKHQETLLEGKRPRAVINCGLASTLLWINTMSILEHIIFDKLKIKGVKHMTKDQWTTRLKEAIATFWASCDEGSFDASQNQGLRNFENEVVEMVREYCVSDGHDDLRARRQNLALTIQWGERIVHVKAEETFRTSGDRGTSILNAINSITGHVYALLSLGHVELTEGEFVVTPYNIAGTVHYEDDLIRVNPFIEGDDSCLGVTGLPVEAAESFTALVVQGRLELGLMTVAEHHPTIRSFCSIWTNGNVVWGHIERAMYTSHTPSAAIKRKDGAPIINDLYHCIAASKYLSAVENHLETPVIAPWFLRMAEVHLRMMGSDADFHTDENKYGGECNGSLAAMFASLSTALDYQPLMDRDALSAAEKYFTEPTVLHYLLLSVTFHWSDIFGPEGFRVPVEIVRFIKQDPRVLALRAPVFLVSTEEEEKEDTASVLAPSLSCVESVTSDEAASALVAEEPGKAESDKSDGGAPPAQSSPSELLPPTGRVKLTARQSRRHAHHAAKAAEVELVHRRPIGGR